MARAKKSPVGPGFISVQDSEDVTCFNALEEPKKAMEHIRSLMTMDAQGLLFYGQNLARQLESQPSESMAMMLAVTRALYLKASGGQAPIQTQEPVIEKVDPQEPQAGPVIETVQGWDGEIPDGTYTVILPNQDYRTLKIQTQAQDSSFMPGKRVMSYLNGPDNWRNYQGFGFVTEDGQFRVWKKHESATTLITCANILLSGPEAMVDGLKAYGKASGSCGLCGKKLTTPESLELGIGPICAGKMGL